MSLSDQTFDRRQFLRGLGVVAAMPAIASLAACGNSATKTETKFIVGFDQDFPPYGYVGDNGEFTGFDLELAKKVCEMEGWTYQPEPIAWDSKDAQLNSGQITCIWNGFTMEGREGDYTFTSPYMENRQVVVVAASSPIKTFADLAGKNVVTQADSAALHLLSEGGAQEALGKTFKLTTIPEYNTAFMSLKSGEYDAIAVDYPVAAFNIGSSKDYVILDEPLNSEHFAVGFAKTDAGKELAGKVEADLKKLDADGFVKQLCEKYGSQGVSYSAWVLPKA